MNDSIKLTLAVSLGLGGLSASAEQLSLDFNLATPTANQNTVPISVSVSYDTGIPFVGTVTDSDSATSTVSGNTLANLDVTFDANGNPTSLNTIAFTGGRVQFDDDLMLDLSFALGIATADINTTGLAGLILTPGGPAPITGGTFSLTPHELTINEGVLTAVGGGAASDINETFDFAADPLTAPLVGNSAISVTLDNIVNGVGFYTAAINAPFAFSEDVEINADASASVSTNGVLVAQAAFTRVISIPSDLDGDGDVDDADFGVAFAAFTGPNNGPSSNPAADLDGDGDVDDADFGIAFAAFTGPNGTASVPEPASAILLGLSALLITRRRRG